MAYYFKPTETRHSILVKNKKYIFNDDDDDDDDDEKKTKKDNIEEEEEEKPILEITYEGFAIFRKSLVVIVEPLSETVEFGNNVRTVSYMSIDDYFGQDYDSWTSDNDNLNKDDDDDNLNNNDDENNDNSVIIIDD
ncbi:hypothetical protein Glove_299g86 [Diversispora epigaea]|uniref:Uncharacterized protein n=1 Tax=Diversispora epigaea TaxID=1348612 RepID=A0A397I0M3_9GLOM|nr:hypothetical protein Glove_299g86 [Diversispora epigaea]